MIRFLLSFVIVTLLTLDAQADPTRTTPPPDGLRSNPPAAFALVGASVQVDPDTVLPSATILVRDGKIIAVGENVQIPDGVAKIDFAGKLIYPGFIDAYAELPADASRADPALAELLGSGYWNSQIVPQLSAANIYRSDAGLNNKLRAQGIVARYVAPGFGIIKGRGAVVSTNDGRVNDVMISTDGGMHVAINLRNRREDGYPTSPMGAYTLVRQAIYDALWHADATAAVAKDGTLPAVEASAALDALADHIKGEKWFIIDAPDELYALRAARISEEFKLKPIVRGSGYEYRVADQLKDKPVLATLNFPPAPNVSSPERARAVTLEQLMHWDLAPENPARLIRAGAQISLSTDGLRDVSTFLKQLRTAVARGLSKRDALAALTTTPAGWYGIDSALGTISPGKRASFIVTDRDIFEQKSKVLETWVDGTRFKFAPNTLTDARGKWEFPLDNRPLTLEVTGDARPGVSITIPGEGDAKPMTIKAENVEQIDARITLTLPGKSLGVDGTILVSAVLDRDALIATAILPDGTKRSITATRKADQPNPESETPGDADKPADEEPTKQDKKPGPASFEPTFPLGAYGRNGLPQQPRTVVFGNVTVWTSAADGVIDNAWVLVRDGRIERVSRDPIPVDRRADTVFVDGRNKMHLTPGIIDAHSHIATDGGINEAGQAITAEVRIGDFIDSTDISIYRQLGGGVTSSNILHGSANPIGGQNQVIKLRWGALPEQLKFENAPPGIKFALGENVKQSNWGERYTTRYPQTRMGVEQIMLDAFRAARDYEAAWKKWNETKTGLPPRRDLELDALVEVLHNRRMVHCHSYRQDEILALIRTAEKIGFSIDTFQHILEGYKVAPEMAAHGAMASAFADWWAYKFEVYDAIPYAGALMHDAGVVVSFNSDDAEMARRLNLEAAKAVRYGGVEPAEALKFVTINAAKQLGIADRVGSIEAGKDADLVLWSGNPLSVASRAEQTWIDGRKYFDRTEDAAARETVARMRQTLIQKVLDSKQQMAGPDEFPRRPGELWPRSDIFCVHHEH